MSQNFTPALGCEPCPQGTTGLPRWGDVAATIPRTEWKPTDVLSAFVPRGKCQFNLPACCTYTEVKCHQTLRAFLSGTVGNYPEISFAAMHEEVTSGRMQQGARPVDCIKIAASRGLIPIGPDAPEFYTSPRRPSGQGREMNKDHEWAELFGVEDTVSAILSLQPCNVCLDWCQRDGNPGPSGELVMNAGWVIGGHSVLACGIRFDYRHSPSGIGVKINNHHGDKLSSGGKNEFGMTSGVWGDDGFGWVPIERLVDGARKYSSTALRTVMIPNEDLEA